MPSLCSLLFRVPRRVIQKTQPICERYKGRVPLEQPCFQACQRWNAFDLPLDPDPFLADVAKRGLPWHVEERTP